MPDLIEIGKSVVGQAKAGEEIEAYLVWERETSIRVYQASVESLTGAESSGIGIRVIRGNRVGVSYAGTLERAEIERALEEARDNSRFASEDPHSGMASPDGVEAPTLDLWRGDILTTPTARKIELAMELERAVKARDSRIRSLNSSNYGDVSVEGAVVNSAGIASYTQQTYCWLWAYALAGTDDETQTGYGMHASRDVAGLDLAFAANEAAEKATRMLGATKPASGLFTVILEPDIASSFLAIAASTLSAEAVQRGRSIFAGRLGEQVASPLVTLVDDPGDPRFFSAAPYDDEGLASRRNVLFQDGILKGFLYDSHTARKDGTSSTGSAIRGGIAGSTTPGPRATMALPGQSSPEQILAVAGDCYLIQSISGIHSGVNPISGDFSVGAEGIRVRGGELAEPVKEFTISSNLQKMLLDVRAVGNDLTFRPGGTAGLTLAIDNVNVSGT